MTQRRPKALRANRILERLPEHERRSLAEATEDFELDPGEILCGAGAKVRHVYFPRRGVVALFASTTDAQPVGVGLVRFDGMFGLEAVAAGQAASRVLAVSQGRGHGGRVEMRAFRALLGNCPVLKDALFVYAVSVAAQMAQNSACIAFHASHRRVARWMLDITEDGDAAGFSSTQADIAIALGLQRPAVSHAAAELQRAGLIRYLRGEVDIVDRTALRRAACACSLRFATTAKRFSM